jgi:hypothetical protein
VSVAQLCFDFLSDVYFVLSANAEGLSESGTAYFEFVVFFVSAEARFYVAAQVGTVFYPDAVGVVYFYDDAVIGCDVDVNQEILFAFEPLFYGLLYCAFADHVLKCFLVY